MEGNAPTRRQLTVRELRDGGYLHEINRRLLHPCGLAATVTFNGNSDDIAVLTILDSRDDPEGFVFDDALLSPAKAALVAGEIAQRMALRCTRFGSAVQPVPGFDDSVPVVLNADDDDLIGFLMNVVDDHYQRVVDAIDSQSDYFVAVIEMLGAIFGSLNIRVDTVGALVKRRPPPPPPAKMSYQRAGRTRHLARILPEMCRPRVVRDGDGRMMPIEAQLYPAEIEEVELLAAEVATWNVPYPDDLERAVYVADRLEDLHAMAQPGMMFWRGDDAARRRWKAVSDYARAEAEKWAAGRSEVDKYLAGAIVAADLTEPKTVKFIVEEKRKPLLDALADLDARRAAVAVQLAPLDRALTGLTMIEEPT